MTRHAFKSEVKRCDSDYESDEAGRRWDRMAKRKGYHKAKCKFPGKYPASPFHPKWLVLVVAYAV